MEQESEIKRLEEFVERLLAGYTGLKAEIKQLKQTLESQKYENETLIQKVEEMASERGDLGSRVSALIDRIEVWESELETADFDEDQPEDLTEESDQKPKKSDKHAGEQSSSDSSGGVQGSLFTANSTTR